MKIKICTKVSASILTILAIMPNIISTAFSDEAQQKSPIYLTLQGVVDLEYGKGPTDPYLVEGRLTGGTSYSLKWIYTISERKQWDPNYGLIALSPYSYQCASTITAGTDLSTGTLEIIPGVNKVGMKLQHTDSQGQLTGNYVYVVPRLAYNIRLTGRGVGSGDGPEVA